MFTLSAFGLVAARPQFDAASDYGYSFVGTGAQLFEAELTADAMTWPTGLSAPGSAWLEVKVVASDEGAPEIVLRGVGREVRHVFEVGARGRRFLDVSPFLTRDQKPAQLEVETSGLEIEAGRATIFWYPNPRLVRAKVMVVAPHPDDAEIAAFGIYQQTQADVITVTAGDAGGENFAVLYPDAGEHFRVKGWIRTWDSISVPFYGGVLPGKARNLGFYDATLARMHAAPAETVPPLVAEIPESGYYRGFNTDAALRERPLDPTWQGLVADLLWELRRVQPTVIVAPHPLLDNHADHQFTTIALIDALEQWGGRCELLLYTNHNREEEAWPLGDRDAHTGLPSWTEGDLFFDRIYSHALSPEDQRRKLIALEAMHDLRDFEISYDGVARDAAASERMERYSYFRRGPRPNELFFVLSSKRAPALRDAFLATLERTPSP
ncbi:PIG-L deacetylase family protein [Synoicihabitans lomoniglobus]|nr:PIG-L family deacetylase [Opitutaceae bacterium LMO-M01]